MISITWTDSTNNTTQNLTINDDAQTSLTSYMNTLTTWQTQTVNGEATSVQVPIYSDILDMILANLNGLLSISMTKFPPSNLQSLADAASQATQALQTAQQTFITSAITPTTSS